MSSAAIWSVGKTSLEIDVTLRSETTTTTRTVRVRMSKLVLGATQTLTADEASAGPFVEACAVLQERAAPTCLTLTGTVDVGKLDFSCYRHQSGIATCAENVDVKLRGAAEDSGLGIQIRLDVVRAEHWSDPDCES